MNNKSHPYTIEEQEAYQNGFEFAIHIVMNILNQEANDDYVIIKIIKEEIEVEIKNIRKHW